MGLEVGNGAQQPPTPTPIPTEEDIDALLEAARYDDIDDIKSLASAGVSLNSKDSQGRTALHMAAANGHLDIVDYLIGNGVLFAEVQALRHLKRNLLYREFVIHSDHEAPRFCNLQLHASVKEFDELPVLYGFDPFFGAIYHVSQAAPHQSRQLLFYYKMISCFMARSCAFPHSGISKDVNATNIERNTPLHWACLNAHVEVIKKLIRAGAAVTTLNSHEHTPIDEALHQGKMEVIDAFHTTIAELEMNGVRVS